MPLIKRIFRLRLAVLLSFFFVTSSALTAETIPALPDFEPVVWLPSAATQLAGASVKLSGISIQARRHQIGDTLTVLAQIREKRDVRQWAVVLALSEIKPEEELLRSPATTLYLSNGSEVEFEPSPFAGMTIHVLGPFSESRGASRAKDIWSGALINPDFLGLGLHRTAALFPRLLERARSDPELKGKSISFDISSRPFSSDKIAEHRTLLDQLAITKTEERAYAGFMPAMMDFFRIASQTPGVREIIFDVADIPWWAILAKGGRITETRFEIVGPFEKLSPGEWNLPEHMEVYSLGLLLHLQEKPVLVCKLALTSPRPPLLNTAGIVAIAAIRPNGLGPRLMIQVMAGEPATSR